jgi:hypothetical protein
MGIPDRTITLHPLAGEYLFKYYNTLRRIFSNVLGQLEIDYLSIALIDQSGQLIFLSSKPSIEQNLIEKNLFEYDGCFQRPFVYQDKPSLWTDLYRAEKYEFLYQCKHVVPNLEVGISIPTDFEEYRVIFSFGFKTLGLLMQRKLLSQSTQLLAIGKYCLREIIRLIPLPEPNETMRIKPRLELIINNKLVNYEKTIR